MAFLVLKSGTKLFRRLRPKRNIKGSTDRTMQWRLGLLHFELILELTLGESYTKEALRQRAEPSRRRRRPFPIAPKNRSIFPREQGPLSEAL
jgi:hypothetical protein